MKITIRLNSLLTEETSSGSTKMMRNEKYQEMKVVSVVKIFCFLRSP